MIANTKRMLKIFTIVSLALTILLSTPMISGTAEAKEIVVKEYSSEWLLVRKDAFSFYMDEIVTYKTRLDRAETALTNTRNSQLLERQMNKELHEVKDEKIVVLENENFRLNMVIDRIRFSTKIKDYTLALSIIGNIVQAIR